MRKYKYPFFAACLLFFNLIFIPPANAAHTNTLLPRVEKINARRDDAPTYDLLPVEEELRKKLKGYIAKDNIRRLLQLLLDRIRPSSKNYNDLCLFSFRFNDLENNIQLGLIPFEKATTLANQIAFGLLNLIDEIPVLEILKIVAHHN